MKKISKYLSNPEVWKYIAEEPYSLADVRQLAAHNLELQIERNGFGDHIPIIQKPGHNLICHMIFRYFYAPYKTLEIGFVIEPAYQGNGYSYEAAIHIMNKLGMRREANKYFYKQINI